MDVDAETGFVIVEFDRALRQWSIWGDHHELAGSWSGAWVRYVAGLLRERGAWPRLVEHWAQADRGGDGEAAWRIGWVLAEQGDEHGSQAAFQRAADRGSLGALYRLIGIAEERGEDTSAARQQAERIEQQRLRDDEPLVRAGDPEALYRRAEWLLEQARQAKYEYNTLRLDHSPRLTDRILHALVKLHQRSRELTDQANPLLEQAALAGSADAAERRGQQLFAADDGGRAREAAQEALPWLRLADELGHPKGSEGLGAALSRLGDDVGTDAAFRRAESRGNPSAPSELAWRLCQRTPPDWDGAEAAYRRATQIGHRTTAWHELAYFLEQRGRFTEAHDAYREALAHNEPSSQVDLSIFYDDHPELRPPNSNDSK